MPLAWTYRKDLGRVVTTVHQGYLDRLSKWSDIQEYLPLLRSIAMSYPGVRVLELGSRAGNSTLAFLAAAVATRGHVTSVDIDNVLDGDLGMWASIPEWTFIHGDDMDPQVQDLLPQEVDVLFIDTSHLYDHTLAELESYMPRVVPGGIALFHDTRWMPGCNGDKWDGTLPPVGRALEDYCAATGMKWTEIPEGYGLGILQKGKSL